ncbi:DUF2357 domain-containing protein [Bizionia paragorgiae]|uniref:DUF2357 domain-containing protein n=1 Tax=Bizionia paragorgiae TaxID=283786 RepID=A0A1H3XNX3_BIZPA|nr:DUF2357 domain-containing protein [Bizionia paragorgiae]SEA01079.1 hypothetical protein SAMN04487990_105105 [Bizionia paragorgiae]
MEKVQSIEIDLSHIDEGLQLFIDAQKKGDIEVDTNNSYEHEPTYQLKEGCFYDFEFSHKNENLSKNYRLFCSDQNNIVKNRKRKEHIGVIAPNIFVGTLTLQILNTENPKKLWDLQLEVQSKKTNYRQDYQYMLNDITSKCTDLIIQANSPVSHSFETDYNTDNKTLYQRFAFVSSIINSDDFEDAVQRIVTSPTTNWTEEAEITDVRKIKRFKNSELKSLINSDNRLQLKKTHPLNRSGIKSIATKIETYRKFESVDTSENRFIKHALETFLKFCMDIANHPNAGTRLKEEADLVSEKLETQLQHDLFKEVSIPTTLKLNSPTLQRKEGYREILNVWLKFDLAAKLVWNGGDEVYSGGKKDIATLYEYWLFFKLLEVLKHIFEIEPKELEKLIVPSNDQLSLQLKQGKITALQGVYTKANRNLNIRFNYNRSFKGGTDDISKPGSWTTTLRPDYTLSIWPTSQSETEAEATEQIVHIHFDAKYKVANINQILGEEKSDNSLDNEKQQNLKGIYKNADLLKMHAYKDAIRRTSGAYVIYPGETNKPLRGFHEVLPGLGAFPIKPSEDSNETIYIENFIKEVLKHFLNTASQRENIAHKRFNVYKNDIPNEVSEPIPEYFNTDKTEKIIPDETQILIGFYNTKSQYDWINKKQMYNFRMGSGNGSLVLDKETVSAKYLLLHTHKDKSSGDLWKIVSKGPKVYSKENLIKKGYYNPSQDYYLVIELEKVNLSEFGNNSWDFRKLKNYNSGNASAKPFTASLTELLKTKI